MVARKICNYIFNGNWRTPRVFIYGGETTVTLNEKNGKGGRNQEFICACLDYINENFDKTDFNWSAVSVGTDGIDYIQDSCGGIIDYESLLKVRKNNTNIKNYLDNHDSHNLLKKIGSNLKINGGTGTNVCDIVIFNLH